MRTPPKNTRNPSSSPGIPPIPKSASDTAPKHSSPMKSVPFKRSTTNPPLRRSPYTTPSRALASDGSTITVECTMIASDPKNYDTPESIEVVVHDLEIESDGSELVTPRTESRISLLGRDSLSKFSPMDVMVLDSRNESNVSSSHRGSEDEIIVEPNWLGDNGHRTIADIDNVEVGDHASYLCNNHSNDETNLSPGDKVGMRENTVDSQHNQTKSWPIMSEKGRLSSPASNNDYDSTSRLILSHDEQSQRHEEANQEGQNSPFSMALGPSPEEQRQRDVQIRKTEKKRNARQEELDPLMMLCRNAKTASELFQGEELINTQSASLVDSQGQTAMHLLSLNEDIAKTSFQTFPKVDDDNIPKLAITFSSDSRNSRAENNVADFVVNMLWKAYPSVMMTLDNQRHIPFEKALVDWVGEMHSKHTSNGRENQLSAFWMTTRIDPATNTGRWPLHLNSRQKPSSDDNVHGTSSPPQSSPTKDVEGGRLSPMRRNVPMQRLFPRHIELTALSIFSIKMLSAILDSIDDMLQLARSVSQDGRGSKHSAGDGAEALALDELKTMTMEDISSEIVKSIASIPNLLKTILLIEVPEQLEYCLGTTVIRRVLASKHSVGPWLTNMLQAHEKRVSDRVIHYMNLVSDIPACMDTSNSSETDASRSRRLEKMTAELYTELSILPGFVPSLLSLNENQLEDASITPVVRKVLSIIISRPFSVSLLLCDAAFLAVLILGFRRAVNDVLLGAVPKKVLQNIYAANVGIFYFIIREIGKGVSLCMITKQARLYLYSFWNLTDLLSTILVLSSTIMIRKFLAEPNSGVEDFGHLRNLTAVSTGMLWLRVLSLLKGVNSQMATFILAIHQITKDVMWFCVIILTLVVSFAQIFFTLLAPNTCAASESNDDRMCVQSEYYLAVYAILLGDFGTFSRDQFVSVFSLFLVVMFTFMVVLVLLNILIAVASDSYEKCLVRSHRLFGRARVMMIAEFVSLQTLLRRRSQPNGLSLITQIYKSWWVKSFWFSGWTRASVVFLGLSSLVVIVWALCEVFGYVFGPKEGVLWLSLGSIIINGALFLGWMLFLSLGAEDMNPPPAEGDGDDSTYRNQGQILCCGQLYGRYLRKAIVRFLGTSLEFTSPERSDDDWRGRIEYLKQEMTKLSDASTEEVTVKIKSLEASFEQTENHLRHETASLQRVVAELQETVNATLKSKEENDRKRDELMESILAALKTKT